MKPSICEANCAECPSGRMCPGCAESCKALVERAFSEGVHRVYAECDPENRSSWHLPEKLGFAREAHLRQNVYFWKDAQGSPIWKDTYLYARINAAEVSVQT